jgi:hypothetical protein
VKLDPARVTLEKRVPLLRHEADACALFDLSDAVVLIPADRVVLVVTVREVQEAVDRRHGATSLDLRRRARPCRFAIRPRMCELARMNAHRRAAVGMCRRKPPAALPLPVYADARTEIF